MLIEVYYERMNYQELTESEAYAVRGARGYCMRLDIPQILVSVGQPDLGHGRSTGSVDGLQRDHSYRILRSLHPAPLVLLPQAEPAATASATGPRTPVGWPAKGQYGLGRLA